MNSVKALVAAIQVVVVTTALPHHNPGATQKVKVDLYVQKVAAEASIAVWSADRSKVFGYKCGTSLNSRAFWRYPVTFDVDAYGAGSLRIGSENFTIHHDPDLSGGIIYGRMHSANEILVTCSFTLPPELQL